LLIDSNYFKLEAMQKSPIIIFSTADWDNPFWTNKQHTAKRLADLGYKVFYIESLGLRKPTVKAQDLSRILKRILSFFKGARKVHKNIWVYSPIVIPLHRFKIIRVLNDILLKSCLSYFKFKIGLKNPIVWTYNPLVLELMNYLKPVKKVYHSVDDLSAAPGMDKTLILSQEEKLLKEMDAVFCTSLKIYDHCKRISGERTHYFSNVVDYEHFSKALTDLNEPDELKNIPHPRIGFVGAISEYKVDFDLINKVSKLKPDWHWVMIGKIGEGQPLSELSLQVTDNIHLLGPKDYKKLPEYIKYFDICSIPTPINDYTQSMFPMKFYEYMAAQKPIVAKNIDSLKEVKEAHYSYTNEKDFIELTELAIVSGQRDSDLCRKLVSENTWEVRLQKMMEVLGE